jgi:hypothetical protein
MKACFQIAECSLSSAKIIKILGIKVILMIFNTDNHIYSRSLFLLFYHHNNHIKVIATLWKRP